MNDEQEFEVSSREAEAKRGIAEKDREVAEGDRRYAESNEETGRRVAEAERVVAEADRRRVQSSYETELSKLQADPAHYMTPGARAYFRRVTWGYIILAAACAIGIWTLSNQSEDQIRQEINNVAKVNCLAGIPAYKKLNDIIDIQIEANRASREINLEAGEKERAALNTKTIVRLQNNKFRVPVPKECEAPLLP